MQRGAFLFMDARISGDGERACADCHPGGRTNGRVYANGVEVEPGTPGGRVTPSLQGVWQSAPYLWDGSLATLEEVLRRMLGVEMRGGRLEGREFEALETYVRSLPAFDRGRLHPDGSPVEPVTLSARRGAGVFLEAGCDLCHPPPVYLRPMSADVGTGGRFNIPTLLGVSSTAPYGHDGRWPTLERALEAILEARESDLDAEQRRRLLAYLMLF